MGTKPAASFIAALVGSLTPGGFAAACTVCDSGTGQAVRAGIGDQYMGLSLLATVLPFLVVTGVVAVVHFGWPGSEKGGGHDGE